MTTFTLEIEIGNNAMSEAWAVAHALRAVADRVKDGDLTGGPIKDLNGNRVGGYGLVTA